MLCKNRTIKCEKEIEDVNDNLMVETMALPNLVAAKKP